MGMVQNGLTRMRDALCFVTGGMLPSPGYDVRPLILMDGDAVVKTTKDTGNRMDFLTGISSHLPRCLASYENPVGREIPGLAQSVVHQSALELLGLLPCEKSQTCQDAVR